MAGHAVAAAEALAGAARSRLGPPSTPASVDSVASGNRTNRPPIRKFRNQRKKDRYLFDQKKRVTQSWHIS